MSDQINSALLSEFIAYLDAVFSTFLRFGRPVSDCPFCLQRKTSLHALLLIRLYDLGRCYIWIVIRINNSVLTRPHQPEKRDKRKNKVREVNPGVCFGKKI